MRRGPLQSSETDELHRYENNLGEPLRAVREDVEREWQGKLDMEIQRRLDVERWSEELVRQLDRERKVRLRVVYEQRTYANVSPRLAKP